MLERHFLIEPNHFSQFVMKTGESYAFFFWIEVSDTSWLRHLHVHPLLFQKAGDTAKHGKETLRPAKNQARGCLSGTCTRVGRTFYT